MSLPDQTVLVTGAAGLIGSAVARLLLAHGVQVVACDDFSIGTWHDQPEGMVWERLDVSDPAFSARMAHHRIEGVVHGAAHPGGRSLQEPSDDVRVNALGSMRVFEWCARSGIPVVYLSSSAVYGDQPPLPIVETAALKPGTVYAVCKVACEHFLRVLEAGYGLQWTILRLFATYGPGHRPSVHQGIVNVLLTQLLAGEAVVVHGRLDRVRDLIYVEDAARAIVECLTNPLARGRTLNVGTGVPTTIRQLLIELCHALGRRLEDVTVTEAEPTVGDPHDSVADISQLTRLGWKPRVSLQAGIERLVRERAVLEERRV